MKYNSSKSQQKNLMISNKQVSPQKITIQGSKVRQLLQTVIAACIVLQQVVRETFAVDANNENS